MRYPNIPEEELKSRVGKDYFSDFDYQKIIGKVDFCVSPRPPKGEMPFQEQSLLWAEAKASRHDVVAMFAQLILTIGKARTFNRHMPPAFLGAFDAEKIAFVAYEKVQHLFFVNDFNWNVAPSDHTTKEFADIKSLIDGILEGEKHLYCFGKDDKDLRFFIKSHLARATDQTIQIDKNNFVSIYLRWLDEIRPLIDVDFSDVKTRYNILDSDFYLADLFVEDDVEDPSEQASVKGGLFVTFYVARRKGEYRGSYEIVKENLVKGLFADRSSDRTYKLSDLARHTSFWNRYKRPPIKEFQDYIIKRRDLLVPQDVRERKGAFFTPKQWVELSQKYLTDVLGGDWQEEYYVWDCAAGTGNLLAGLTNKYNIWASTLDQADVNVMHERINNSANLLKSHVFQFDFLNDDFGKLPQSLQKIINSPEKRKKLVVYINPPYAETGSTPGRAGKKDVQKSKTHTKYGKLLAVAGRELFAQFLIRIYCEIPDCKIANFSKLKGLQSSAFSTFRSNFRTKLEKIFLIPAYTFDNVTGKFPIGFFVWDTAEKEAFSEIVADVYSESGKLTATKNISITDKNRYISNWITAHKATEDCVAFLAESTCSDFQHNRNVRLANKKRDSVHARGTWVNAENLMVAAIFLAVRHCIKATWLNDRDQFLWPNGSWESDMGFHNDCLVFTLFHGQNRITSKEGTNHWIPFTEQQVNAQDRFDSRFMSDFIAGKIKKTNGNGNIFEPPKKENGTKCRFSPEAQSVLDAGREIWKYYHSQKGANANASLYDIREHFQGRNEKGTMNAKSADEKYTELMGILREKQNVLADKIAAKVYEHGFLM